MSTQQILGVAGFVVGSFFGYPQLGFVVGSLVGSALTPKTKTEGPRLDDLKVTVSTYGGGIPILYGNERLGGNVIWSTDKIEVATTEEQGKGGGAEYTTYKYYVHMAIALCETPRNGATVRILKTFKDGKIVSDLSVGLDAGSVLASAIAGVIGMNSLSVGDSPTQPTLYQGSPDQLPDPTMESLSGGPGSVAAYRGIVYIFLPGVECPGGRVPQYSFVLSSNADLQDEIYLGEEVVVESGEKMSASRISSDGTSSIIFVEYADGVVDHTTKRVRTYSLSLEGAAVLTNEFVLGDEYWGAYTALSGDADIDAICFREVDSVTNDDYGFNVIFDPDGVLIRRFNVGFDIHAFGQSNSSWSKRGDFFLISGDSSQGSDEICLFNWNGEESPVAVIEVPSHQKVVLTGSTAWVLVGGTSPSTLQARELDFLLTLVDSVSLPAETAGMELRLTGDSGDTLVLWASNDTTGNIARLYKVSLEAGSIVFTLTNEAVRVDGTIPHPIQPSIGAKPGVVYGWERLAVGATTTLRSFMIAFDRLNPEEYAVSEIVADLCERAGETRFDVTGIPDTDAVHGYKLQNPASARANMDPLFTAFGIYVVEEDGLIKFKKYEDITSVATISYDDLGQSEGDSEGGGTMPLSRAQEIDLPRSVTCSYIEPSFDYQAASEKEIRLVTEATEDIQLEIPIALNGSNLAKQVAQRTLYARWLSQNTRSTKVSRKYAFVSPGDGVTIEYPRGTTSLWRVMTVTDTGAMCEWNLEPGDAELMAQTAIGATGYTPQQVSRLPPPTRMVIGDWPLLRDADNNAGIYTAFGPLGSTAWRGATLFVGDDDASLQERGTVSAAASIGVAETVLGDWVVNERDQANTMIVNASDDANFGSTTFAALIANPALNACAVGKPGRWEILQFATASYLGDRQWLIYDFLRGQRGTEHSRGNHESGDTFVLLTPASMLRPNMDVGALNQIKQYRAVSLGRAVNSVASQSYANTGEGLRPLSPVNLRHSLVGGEIVFAWNRRTRLSNNWLAGIVPLGEASEAYVLRLYTEDTYTTVLRTLAVTTSAATYTASQMAADSYTPGDPLYVRVGQVSDSIGLGHELQETL